MTEESKLYHIEKIVTYRYRCVKCGVYGSEDSYYDDEPCSSCSGGKSHGKQTVFKVQEVAQDCKVLKKFGGCTQVQYIKLTPSEQKTKKDSGMIIELVLS
ncbi:MAG: putative regulatory protein [Circular genetic element sp.]|nr:MAG: putative regulatory protein [Circular genetic element sp.]